MEDPDGDAGLEDFLLVDVEFAGVGEFPLVQLDGG